MTDFLGRKYTKPINVDSIVVYSDDNIQLRYSCTNINNYWFADIFQYFFILVRDRNFDSIKQITPSIQIIQSLGINLNSFVLAKNINCTN